MLHACQVMWLAVQTLAGLLQTEGLGHALDLTAAMHFPLLAEPHPGGSCGKKVAEGQMLVAQGKGVLTAVVDAMLPAAGPAPRAACCPDHHSVSTHLVRMKTELTEDMLIQTHALRVIGVTTHVHFMHMYRKFFAYRAAFMSGRVRSTSPRQVHCVSFLMAPKPQSNIITAPHKLGQSTCTTMPAARSRSGWPSSVRGMRMAPSVRRADRGPRTCDNA